MSWYRFLETQCCKYVYNSNLQNTVLLIKSNYYKIVSCCLDWVTYKKIVSSGGIKEWLILEECDRVSLKHLVITSQIKTPVVSVEFYGLQNWLQIVKLNQFYNSTWVLCLYLCETEQFRKRFSVFKSEPIQRWREGRKEGDIKFGYCGM